MYITEYYKCWTDIGKTLTWPVICVCLNSVTLEVLDFMPFSQNVTENAEDRRVSEQT